jgi:two-component system phosphate regulon sensor histidine kinase PhoR
VLNADERYLGTRVSNRDVTDRKRAELELCRAEANLRALLDSSHQLFVLVDRDYRVVDLNRTVQEVVEDIWSRDIFPGANILDFVRPEDREQFEHHYRLALQGHTFSVEKMVSGKTRTHHWEVVHYPVRDADGDVVGICISSRDISERKQAAHRKLELELEKERSRILTEFIHNASHEFRTPLSQIALDAYFLEMPGEEDRRMKYINSIKRQTATLGRLVERLVQTAELGQTAALEAGPLDLNAALARTISSYEPAALEKGLTIERRLDENLPDCLADEGRLLLAFSSLLDNAIRYTEQGEVTVRSRQEGERLLVEVEDTGVGIRPEDLPRIFERFYREDRAHTTEGFGLGLSIARRIVELHGGEIEVESERGQGSVFRVWLPVAVEG